MPKSKHSFQKRQREIDKKKKREEKLQRKIDKKFQPPATFEEMIEGEVQPGTEIVSPEKTQDDIEDNTNNN